MSTKPRTTIQSDEVICPNTGTEMTTQSIVDAVGKVLLVVRCSRFDPTEAMDCDTPCMAALDGTCRHG